MGEGLDKIAKSLLDLEPTAILDLFLVFPDPVKKPGTSYAIHNGSNFKKGITWQGRDYMPMGMEIEGFEINADGRVNRPKIKISNKDYFITNLLRKNEDFKNARVTRIRTFVKFLDDKNFDGGNPFGDPDSTAELSRQEYIVSQKVQENKIYVELELTSPLDLDNFEINSRRIMGKYCYWQYRGMGCQYKGAPVQKEDGTPFKDVNGRQMGVSDSFSFEDAQDEYNSSKDYTTGDLVFIKNSKVRIEDPKIVGVSRPLLNYYMAKTDVRGLSPDDNPQFWDKEGCNKKLSSCKLRFTEGKAVTRFVSSREVVVSNSQITYDTDDANPAEPHNFEPENSLPFRQAMSGNNGWTLSINYAAFPFGSPIHLQTNQDKYGGINVAKRWFITNGAITSYAFFKNAAGSSDNISFGEHTEKDGSLALNDRSRLIIRVSEGKSGISIYQPGNNSKKINNNGISEEAVYEMFRLSSFSRDNDWGQYYNKPSSWLENEGFCFWDRELSDDEVNSLYIEKVDGTFRMKPIDTFEDSDIPSEQAIMNGLLGWWDQAFAESDGTGFYDKSQYKNNLLLSEGYVQYTGLNFPEGSSRRQSYDFVQTDAYLFEVNRNVTTQEEVSYLPFGGFPGTDGFDFQRAT